MTLKGLEYKKHVFSDHEIKLCISFGILFITCFTYKSFLL